MFPCAVFAQVSSVSSPNYFKKVGAVAINPIVTTYQLGDSGTGRWDKLYVKDLDVSGTFVFTGTMGSNLDMDGYNLIMDTDGDSAFLNDRDASIGDDEIGVQLNSAIDFEFETNLFKVSDGSALTVENGYVMTQTDIGGNVSPLIVEQNDTTNNKDAVTIANAGTGRGIYLDHNGAGGNAVVIDSESTATDAISVLAKYGAKLEQDITSGYGLWVMRNINEAGSNALVSFVNDHANDTQPTLRLQHDGTGLELAIEDGIFNFGGYGATQNENLALDFETVANHIGATTATGVTDLDFTAIDLNTTTEVNAENLVSTDDADIADNLTAGDIAIDEATGVLDFTGATSGEIEVSTGNLILDIAGDEVNTPDGKDNFIINLPISGADAGTHDVELSIDSINPFQISATGDGTGGIGAPTTSIGVTAKADVVHIGDADALVDLTDAHWSITEAGTISGEQLTSTDDADITDNITAGDVIIDEAVGTLDFTGGTSATITSSGFGTIGFSDDNLTTTGTLQAGNITSGANGADGLIRIYSEVGGTDYDVTLNPHATSSTDLDIYFPATTPAGTYLLNMTSGGQLGYDSSVYLTAESDTLQTVTTRGATTTTNIASTNATAFTGGEDIAGGNPNVAGQIKLWSSGDDNMYNTFTSGDNSANATYTLPTAMPASSGYTLASTDAGVMSWVAEPAEADTLQTVTTRGTTTTTSLTSTNAICLTGGEDVAGGNPNVAGSIKLFSAGDNAYFSTLTAGTNSSDASFILPIDEPAGTYILNMTTGGQIGYDASTYLTAEADTLNAVIGRGATTATSAEFQNATAGVIIGKDIAGGTSNDEGIIKLWSDGDNAYSTLLKAGTNSSDATYILPIDEPAGTYLLNMTTGGQIGYDTSTYLTSLAGDTTPELGGDLSMDGYTVYASETDNGTCTGTDTIDWGAGNNQKSTLSDNCTYTFTAPAGVSHLTLRMIQDADGTNTMTFPATVKWEGGSAPSWDTTAGRENYAFCYWNSTNYICSGIANITP